MIKFNIVILSKVGTECQCSALYSIAKKAVSDKGFDASNIYMRVKERAIDAFDFARHASIGQHLRVLVEAGVCSNRFTGIFLQLVHPEYRRSAFYGAVVTAISGEELTTESKRSKKSIISELKIPFALQTLFGMPVAALSTNEPKVAQQPGSNADALEIPEPQNAASDPLFDRGLAAPQPVSEPHQVAEIKMSDVVESAQIAAPSLEVVVCSPQSEAHKKRMDGWLAEKAVDRGGDPRHFTQPHDYRRHLNAELAQKGQFLLGERFFDISDGGQEWRGETPAAPEIINVDDIRAEFGGKLKTDEDKKWFSAMTELWPDGEGGSVSFAEFVYGSYGKDIRRYDKLSEGEQKLLKNIILQVRKLTEELKTTQDPERKALLTSTLGAIGVLVRGHENACSVRLQEILRIVAEQIDSLSVPATASQSNSSPAEVGKRILTKYRGKIIKNIFDPENGSFFKIKHKALGTLGKTVEEVDFQCKMERRTLRAGRDLELRCAARVVVSDAWGIPGPKIAQDNLGGELIGHFRFADFIDPFLQELSAESLAEVAKEEFRKMSPEAFGEVLANYFGLKISFSEYCSSLGVDANEVRKNILDCQNAMKAQNALQENESLRNEAVEIGFQDLGIIRQAQTAGLLALLNDPLEIAKIFDANPDLKAKFADDFLKNPRGIQPRLLIALRELPAVVQLAEALGKKNPNILEVAAKEGIKRDADLFGRAVAAGKLDDGQKGHFDALMQWCTNVDLTDISMQDIMDHIVGLEYTSGEILPELFCSNEEKPGVAAKLFFPKYLYAIGALVDKEAVAHAHDEDTGSCVGDLADIEKFATETLECIRDVVLPERFVVRPTYADDMYFEMQRSDTGTCGIHALNNFFGKPLFRVIATRWINVIFGALNGNDIPAYLADAKTYLLGVRELYDKVGKNNTKINEINKLLSEIDSAVAFLEKVNEKSAEIQTGAISILNYKDLAENVINLLDGLKGRLIRSAEGLEYKNRPKYERYNDIERLCETYCELNNGMEAWILKAVFENQIGIQLHSEEGKGAAMCDGDGLLAVALKENNLPNGADRAIIGSNGHFVCLRRLTTDQWIVLDSYQSDPYPIPDNDLAKYIASHEYCQVAYCDSLQDREKFEAFLAENV